MYKYQSRLNLKPGDIYRERDRKARVEGVGANGMYALVYYGKGDYRVVENRPIFYTSNDLIIKVKMVHRCGTEMRYYQEGHPLVDSILIRLLANLAELHGEFDPSNLREYVRLLEMEKANENIKDELYERLAKRLESLRSDQRANFCEDLFREWGRVAGHEMVGVIEKVGSNVKNLTKPLGYTSTWLKRIPKEYLNFKEGERAILQSRCATYKPVSEDLHEEKVAGTQLLGMDIEDVSRTLEGGFAQYIRVTAELIRSGCVIRVPDNVSDVEAALIEPTACLIDCLDLATHPEGQDEQGNIMKKGVARGGVTAIIGSGAMAFIAAEVALTLDSKMQVGGASKVVMFVRSEDKARLGEGLLGGKFGNKVEFFVYDSNLPYEKTVERFRREYGGSLMFNDIIIAAGDVGAVKLAHRMVSGTGWRIHTFAGTHGEIAIESGGWHYSNAGTSGTSGCNTRAMENVLKMIERGSIELSKFSGNRYTFRDLKDEPSRFFADKYLRPVLLPNEGMPKVKWQEI